ncbi:isochorismatase family protein [Burkholderia guangdongensis]|uniref:isochorismatase family protein n=1 Tax=Burkholderia guangdongensis TaxID=1792500 RepID=UPI0015CDC3D7|nr:isochorismatase family protein [Burkholderia guangdongensis]
MPLTTLDPNSALIVVDLQKGIASFPSVHPMADVVTNASGLAAAFRRHDLPVVLVNVTGGAPGRAEQGYRGTFPADFADLLPELGRQPRDHVVTKQTWGAFTGTDLDAYLREAGVTQVVLCGVATSIGVESTARYAHELGFNVTLAVDAMTDMDADAHANSLARIFPRLGETGATQEIIDLLDQRG